MQAENRDFEAKAGNADTSECPSCRATLVAGMRFCRLCGYRLGEGVEEYAETRRFDAAMPPVGQRPATGADPFVNQPNWGAVPAPFLTTSKLNGAINSSVKRARIFCNVKQMNWMMWMLLVVAIMTAGGIISKRVRQEGVSGPPPLSFSPSSPRSMLGLSDLDSLEDGGGALVEAVAISGTPADKAGLIGGDQIIELNGQHIEDADDLRAKLAETPVGAPVEITYIRDGQTQKTTIATISPEEYERLRAAERARNKGFLGIDPGELERVDVPGQNIKGVQMGEVQKNRPGYIAGLRSGDVVLEFDGHPVRTEKDFLRRINQATPDSVVKFLVMRDGQRLEIPVKMGSD